MARKLFLEDNYKLSGGANILYLDKGSALVRWSEM